LIAGSGGVFDVRVDGRLVYSKHNTGRFPEPGEVVRIIRTAG
jgi:selenoprotein W-related protein